MNILLLPLLLFYTFLAKNILFSLIILGICIVIFNFKNRKLIPLAFISWLASFDIIFSVLFINLLEYKARRNSSKIVLFVFLYVFSFVSLSLIDYNFKAYFIYFYGIPATLVISLLLFYPIAKFKNCKKICIIGTYFVILFTFFSSFHTQKNGLNIGITNNEKSQVITYNSLKNSDYYQKCIVLKLEEAKSLFEKTYNKYSIFLPEYKENIESLIVNDKDIQGDFYLYGEHDNFNNFIKNNESQFINGHFQRQGPWHINNLFMERCLQRASYIDFFLCSNIGTTLKISHDIIPLVWDYTIVGIPKIIIGKKNFKKKRVFYVSDSDPFVGFLATYNTYFLSILYGYLEKLDIIRIILITISLILFLLKRNSQFITLLLCLSLCLTYMFKWDNTQIFDYNVYQDCRVYSPHIENDPANFIKNISLRNNTVSINSKARPKKANIYIVTGALTIDEIDNRTTSIFFVTSSGMLTLGGKKYVAVDIPQGNINNVVDALYINNSKSPIIKYENNIIIGTNSPQRNSRLLELLQ